MKQRHWRLSVLAFFVLGLATILTTRADCYTDCDIDDIEDEVTSVEVTLTANPSLGPVPLSVKFTSTAKAIIHYEDEVCITKTEEGSVEDRTPLYREETLTPDKPADRIIEESGTYPFTATAEYKGVTGKATVTVDTWSCDKLQAQVDEALKAVIEAKQKKEYAEAKIVEAENNIVLADVTILEKSVRIGEATAQYTVFEIAKKLLSDKISKIVNKIKGLRELIDTIYRALEDKIKRIKAKIAEFLEKTIGLDSELAETIVKMSDVQKYIGKLEGQIKDARKDKKYWTKKLPGLKKIAHEYWPQRIRDLTDKYDSLKEDLDACLGK